MLERHHVRHIVLNVAGMVLPMVVGVLVIPDLVRRLGTDRYGVLAISWVLVGYFGLLDLGLGRGLTQYLARQSATGSSAAERAATARRVRIWMASIGVGWTVVLLLSTPWISQSGLKMPVALRSEATAGWICLALSVPFFMWASSSIGVLEAYSRFAAVNAVRIPMGTATFMVPWVLAHATPHLGVILGGLLAVRVAAALALAGLSRRHFVATNEAIAKPDLRRILVFGGWLSLSNLVGPVLAYFDRFAIGALLSVTAVTYYTVPFDLLSRLPALPVAMMGVFFPMLAHAVGANDRQLPAMVRAASQMLVAYWVPGLAVCGLLGHALLGWWIGAEIADASSGVWAWLALGVLLNGFAHVPYTLLHSAGRTDVTAKLHLAELLPYLLALWWALQHHGITGAAAVWTLRVLVDTLLLFAGAARLFPALRSVCLSAAAWAVGSCAALALAIHTLPADALSPLGLIAAALLWSGLQGWLLHRTRM